MDAAIGGAVANQRTPPMIVLEMLYCNTIMSRCLEIAACGTCEVMFHASGPNPFVLSSCRGRKAEVAYRSTEQARKPFDTALRMRSAPTQDKRGGVARGKTSIILASNRTDHARRCHDAKDFRILQRLGALHKLFDAQLLGLFVLKLP